MILAKDPRFRKNVRRMLAAQDRWSCYGILPHQEDCSWAEHRPIVPGRAYRWRLAVLVGGFTLEAAESVCAQGKRQ